MHIKEEKDLPDSPTAQVIVFGIIIAAAVIVVFGLHFVSQKPVRQERKANRDSNEYMTRVVCNSKQVRHIRFFADGVSIPDISFDGRLEFVETASVNHAYIDGIEAALSDLRLHPTNPVRLYTFGNQKPSPAAGLFMLGAINAYRTKLVHVIQFDWDGEKLTEVYDSTQDGEYTSHMLSEDIKKILPAASVSW